MKKFGVLLISTAVLFVGVVVLSFYITDRLNDYKNTKEQIAEEMNWEERLLTPDEYLDVLPFFDSGEDLVERWGQYENEAKAKYNGALFYGAILVCLILIYVGLNVLVYKDKEWRYQIYGLIMIFSALSFLFLGLQSPFIEIMAYEKDIAFDTEYFGDFEFPGRTYFLYQNKSIFQLIHILYTGGNFLVAIAVAVFSVIFPLVKSVVSIFVLFSPGKKKNIRRYKVIRNMGKWSMADVFVAAIFLAFFAYSNLEVGVDTGSETLIGTYFYMAFVMLSINSGQYLKKAMRKAQEIGEWDLD